jgi:Ni,Fe-hydrogenase III small subunit/formate hydrogenlyase subunit 6/NADH:ubiquinone oxidoreductase subunit I
MFRMIATSLKTGILTEKHPFASPPPFGFPVIDFARCTACDECARACPTGAIQSIAPTPGRRTLSLSHAACIQCRECIEACPERAVSPGHDFEIAAYTREQLTRTALFDVDGSGRATFRQVEAQPGPGPDASAERLRERIRGRLGRSLHVRQVDAGSCNGCELEIAATTNPVFDLERFGIHFVASPRHADLLLVTGPVTRNMEIALRRTYEATPEPRIVVAVGACGCSGGIFGEGTYASVGGVDRVVPVDVYVPGCPPRPQAILNGLLVGMGRREARLKPDGRAASPEPAVSRGTARGRPPILALVREAKEV